MALRGELGKTDPAFGADGHAATITQCPAKGDTVWLTDIRIVGNRVRGAISAAKSMDCLLFTTGQNASSWN